MLRVLRIILLLGLLLVALGGVARAASSVVVVLRADGIVNPVLADYISRGIEAAEEMAATAVVIQLDTPGGLDTAMRDIIQVIVNARVPVVVFVSPSGGRAASAGVFITVAAHVAAMAPNTAIGAASPVSIGPEGEAEMSETMREKVLNDAAAYVRSLAQAQGRNIEWAEQAVREAVSATDQEALELNVIDLVAADLADLLAKLDGREVTLLGGVVVTLETGDAVVNLIEMTWMERFLFAITDPNIAFVLMGLATLGLFVEISNPGLIFPGVVGGISAILAFYSLGNLPVDIAGILLVVGAFGLFIAEAFTASFGLLTGGGVIALVLGSLIMFKGGPLFQINPWLIGILAAIFVAVSAFIVHRVIVARRQPVATGREELVGMTAEVKTTLDPEGTVLFKGELWAAVSESGRVELGESVVVDRVERLTLHVSKKEPEGT